jgi:uncharacterized protein (TIGR03437 family)
LPSGASFDPELGVFDWVPNSSQQGIYDISFTVTEASGNLTTEHVKLEVDSGSPAVTRIVNAASRSTESACSPGALASIEGKWLAAGSPVSEPSGSSVQLAGTTVRVNEEAVPIVYASPSRVDFLCPNSDAGSTLSVVVDALQGSTLPVKTVVGNLSPGIFSADGTGSSQGAVTPSGNSDLVMARNYRSSSQPARPGDHLLMYVTGINGAAETLLNIGGIQVTPDSKIPRPRHAGVFQLDFTVPQGIGADNNTIVYLTTRFWDGKVTNSNSITIAIEN